MSSFAINSDCTRIFGTSHPMSLGVIHHVDGFGNRQPPLSAGMLVWPAGGVGVRCLETTGTCFVRRDGMDTMLFNDKTCIWEIDAKTGTSVRRIPISWDRRQHCGYLASQIACMDNVIAATVRFGNFGVALLNYDSGTTIRFLRLTTPYDATSVAFTTCGKYVIVAAGQLWKLAVRDGRVVSRLEMPGMHLPLYVAVLQDDSIAVACHSIAIVSVTHDFSACDVLCTMPFHGRPVGFAHTTNDALLVEFGDRSTRLIPSAWGYACARRTFVTACSACFG